MGRKRRSNGQGSLIQRKPRGPWLALYYDHDGKRREKSTKTADKRAAERILAKLVADVALRREGVIDPRSESIGVQARRPIDDHLNDWRASLEAKGNSLTRIQVALNRASYVAKTCKFANLIDVAPGRIPTFIKDMNSKSAAARTINGYLQAFKQFIRWAVADRRLSVNPLIGVGMVKVIGQTRTRRTLSEEELNWLVDSTQHGPALLGMTGQDRSLLYLLAAGTGFRASELASLMPTDFRLDVDPPTVRVKAGYSKRRREDVQPIRMDLAQRLMPWLSRMPADEPVFRMPEKTARMIRADLRRAKARWIKVAVSRAERRQRRRSEFLTYLDSEGRVADFHALRATYITMLVRSGASVKVAQELARHSDPKLTMNVYTQLGVHDLAGALDRLPVIPQARDTNDSHVARATGTDGVPLDTQLNPQQYEHDKVRTSATSSDHRDRSTLPQEGPKSLATVKKRTTTRPGATRCNKATSGIRTPDLCFTKALLYR